ncbi:3-methyl-2-oxobutanoate hydroxymethyltransferase [Serinibacter arcticus]|uniref:3-methyl-2-oxobutanoate hydroxymethyltransferase n=1 Tax=Serinibacter arcticus TaxID=1655435 RepID=A0A2U1ZZH3_9MICO|nr:3-methyl-2-oxobutanoate hydroxymethyltransferase [Serinibacter arcticus]PWD52343.1 3-methyl-2-oxobutanoate hydroxymethyltransferase [Serinibacter arcticus]
MSSTPGVHGSASSSPATPAAPTAPPRRVRVQHLREAKDAGRRLTMLTAYDAPTARIFDEAGVDMLLVGDSIGDNMLGHDSTIPVTMDELVPAVRAVSRASRRALVVADLPFGSYEASPQQAHAAAVRMLKEGGANAVKIEGGRRIAAHVELLSGAGIPVVGHLGLTPQAENMLGGKRVQGRGADAADALLADAVALAEAGAVAIVLEMIPEQLAQRVTDRLAIPTIGIGAGNACDGQVLVWLDMAGMGDWSPRFAKQFGAVGAALSQATSDYVDAVRSGTFPGPEHTFTS